VGAKRTVWKYPIPVDVAFELWMPRGAAVLSVQVQGGAPCIWVLADPDAPKELRSFVTLGTGHVVGSDLLRGCDFVGTYQLEGSALVFHLWAEK